MKRQQLEELSACFHSLMEEDPTRTVFTRTTKHFGATPMMLGTGESVMITVQQVTTVFYLFSTSLVCTTTGGDDKEAAPYGTECMFPFTFGGNEYYGCTDQNHTTPWCYTDDDFHWGECDDNCPTGKTIPATN